MIERDRRQIEMFPNHALAPAAQEEGQPIDPKEWVCLYQEMEAALFNISQSK